MHNALEIEQQLVTLMSHKIIKPEVFEKAAAAALAKWTPPWDMARGTYDSFGQCRFWCWSPRYVIMGVPVRFGAEYAADNIPLPRDGGTVAAGQWTHAKPTGNKKWLRS